MNGDAKTPEAYEAALPSWQRGISHFAEGWIGAFLVILILRHFLLVPFRIPSSSMEPTMLGDPSFTKGDFVVVDSLSLRFRDPKRFEVTVFQNPMPEIQLGKAPSPAYDGQGHRLDSFPGQPNAERSFVKRCLVLPGDSFYFANGDMFLRRPDGKYTVERKPAEVQEALWMPIYKAGAQEGYVPWKGREGASATITDQTLTLKLLSASQPEIVFAQPFTNFYLKEGRTRVVKKDNSGISGEVEASMLAPLFNIGAVQGNIWDFDTWRVFRLTSADLDHTSGGSELNARMNEMIGDLRIGFKVTAIEGRVILRQAEGNENSVELALSPTDWELIVDGKSLAKASVSPVGHSFQLATWDDGLELRVDGNQVAQTLTKATNPMTDLLSLRFTGLGMLSVGPFTIDRDVHWCQQGILTSQIGEYEQFVKAEVPEADTQAFLIRRLRRQFISTLTDPALKEKLLKQLNAAEEGFSARSSRDWLAPLAVSPETALTAPAYMLMGDNSPFSYDSRSWGYVPKENIRGRVQWVVLPPSRTKTVR